MANYANDQVAALVAAHTIGKSFISAPLNMGENIDDIGGPAQITQDINRLFELVYEGPDGTDGGSFLDENGKYARTARLIDIEKVDDIICGDKSLICVPDTMYNIGDVVFYSPITNKFSKVSNENFIHDWGSLTNTEWDNIWHEFALNNIPIGIIVIPSSLDIYGDGSALLASIRPLDRQNTAHYYWTGQVWSPAGNEFVREGNWDDNNSSSNRNPSYGVSDYPDIESYGLRWMMEGASTSYTYSAQSIPQASMLTPLLTAFKWLGSMFMIYESVNYPLAEASIFSGSTLNTNTGHSIFPNYHGVLPINYPGGIETIDTYSDDVINHINAGTYFKIKSLVTYQSGDPQNAMIKNPNQFNHLVAVSAVDNNEKNAMMDFNGYDNTKILQHINDGYDWQTLATHVSDYYSQNLSSIPFPAVAQVWEFYTPGTNRGDWYIPSLGEMAFIMRELNPASKCQYINILGNCYGYLGVTFSPNYVKINPLGPVYSLIGDVPTSATTTTCWCTSSIMYDPDWGNVGLYKVSYYNGEVSYSLAGNQMPTRILPVMRIR